MRIVSSCIILINEFVRNQYCLLSVIMNHTESDDAICVLLYTQGR